jgi:hypothetical protein
MDHQSNVGQEDGFTTAEFTSLKHFNVRQNRHQPIKRDAVE